MNPNPAPVLATARQSISVRHPARRALGFTLIELLTVIAIIGILAAIIIPVTGKIRQTAKKATCGSNMRQLSQALLIYTGDNRGRFPMGLTWDTSITPYIGVGQILAQPVASRPSVSLLVCPSDTRTTPTRPRSYGASAMSASAPGKGVFSRKLTEAEGVSLRLEQLPQPGRTILIAESYTGTGRVDSEQFNGAHAIIDGWLNTGPRLSDGSYYHGTTQNYGFADGHVESLNDIQVQTTTGGFGTGGRWQAIAP